MSFMIMLKIIIIMENISLNEIFNYGVQKINDIINMIVWTIEACGHIW